MPVFWSQDVRTKWEQHFISLQDLEGLSCTACSLAPPAMQSENLPPEPWQNHSVPFRFNLQTACITYCAPKAKEKTHYTFSLHRLPYHSLHQDKWSRWQGKQGTFMQPDLLYVCPFSSLQLLFKQVCMWLDGGDGGEKCCSHQWELYGVLKWAHSASECSAACVFSPSIDRKLHPRLLARSLTASIASSDHQKQTDLISHPPPHE